MSTLWVSQTPLSAGIPLIAETPMAITDPPGRLLTVADLAVMPDDLPSGPVKYELFYGRLSVNAAPEDAHGAAQSQLGTYLVTQGQSRGHGKARLSVALILRRNPDHVLVPDALFITNRSLPIRRSPEGYLETIPDLVVEVQSKNDSRKFMERKAAEYLAAGVRVVWVADPAAQSISVFRPDVPSQSLAAHDTLTIEDIIPGFSVPVRDFFMD